MPTYYEILKLAPTATAVEIAAALDAQYNQWRRLVTHHAPTIVEEANRALRTLEQVRATLTDPGKRAVYDSTLNVGGLADPEALLRAAAPLPPPQTSQQTPVTHQRADAWVCPNCQTSNPLKTKFCSKCGQQLGRDCPSCGKLTKASGPFCMECGVNFDEYLSAQHEKRCQAIRESLAQISSLIEKAQNSKRRSELSTVERRIVLCGQNAMQITGELPSEEAKMFRDRIAVLMEQAEKVIAGKGRWLLF